MITVILLSTWFGSTCLNNEGNGCFCCFRTICQGSAYETDGSIRPLRLHMRLMDRHVVRNVGKFFTISLYKWNKSDLANHSPNLLLHSTLLFGKSLCLIFAFFKLLFSGPLALNIDLSKKIIKDIYRFL